jgi:hypothetical protein
MTTATSFVRLPHVFTIIVLFVLAMAGCKEKDPVSPIDLADPSIIPIVHSTYPANGTTGPFKVYNRGESISRPHFLLTFNKLMYLPSFNTLNVRVSGFDRPVIARVQSLYGPIYKTSSIQSPFYDNVVGFVIWDSLHGYSPMIYRVGQRYTVTIDNTIEDINGNKPVAPYTFSFTPEPSFRIISFSPAQDSKDLSATITPAIEFNSPITSTILPFVQLNPLPQGKWILAQYDSLRVWFSPNSGRLAYGTEYTMSVDGNARDGESRPIDQSGSATFTISLFKMSYSYPHDKETGVPPITQISVGFSGPIDTSTVRNAFSVSPPVAGALLSYDWGTLTFAPALAFRTQTTYTVSLAAGLKASDGTALLPSSFSFTTENFKITSTSPDDGATGMYRSVSISVYFNTFIDTGSVRGAFSISPPVAGSFGTTYGPASQFIFSHNGLSANTTYSITISTAMKSALGDYLQTPYSFSFSTGQ